MAAACQQVRLVADLTMHVPRDAAGDLECGAQNVLHGVDAVDSVERVDVTNLQPRLNDLQIEATAAVAVAAPDVDAAGELLADGFGVADVEHVRADHAEADASSDAPVQEYG